MHIASEESKFGLDVQELQALLLAHRTQNNSWVELRGLMGMATFSDDEQLVRSEFKILKQQFDAIRVSEGERLLHWDTLSMGMSGDWKWAVEEGSTMVRIGSAIFGERKKATT